MQITRQNLAAIETKPANLLPRAELQLVVVVVFVVVVAVVAVAGHTCN